MAGNILGRIHAIEPKNVSHQEPEVSKIDWHGYSIQAKEQMSEIASLLAENEEVLIYAEEDMITIASRDECIRTYSCKDSNYRYCKE